MKANRAKSARAINILGNSTDVEKDRRQAFFDLFENCPIQPQERLMNLGLFINRQALSRIMFMYELYKQIVNIHGVVMEFGVRWGQNLALFENFRGMLEPFNYNRKIIGFDTFAGFPETTEQDGQQIKKGDYAVSIEYEKYLEKILKYHELESPIPHISKFEIVKGDACVTTKEYLKKNPETIIALAYFDMDIYKPTAACLELIRPHMAKGAIVGFDELNVHDFPGETIAFKEVFNLNQCRIHRSPLSPLQSWIVIE